MPKISNFVKFLGVQIFKGNHNILRYMSAINMYEIIKIRRDILIQYHGNDMKREKFNYMLEINISKNCTRGAF